jgi:PIN domain nuclease of toxin-antitoxin system
MGSPPLILLDTHLIVWLDAKQHRIGQVTLEAIGTAEAAGALAYSVTTLWELGTLARKGRLDLGQSLPALRDLLRAEGLQELPIDGPIALQADDLPGFHADPADRFIVATALAMDATLVTADERILGWAGPLRRLDARA